MHRVNTSIIALALAGLPLAAAAETDAGERILACEADRAAEGCAVTLTRIFVCERAEAMEGCAELLASYAGALEAHDAPEDEVDAAEDAADDAEGADPDDNEEFVSETEEVFDVEPKAEGEAADESDPDGDEPGAEEGDGHDDGDEEILPRQN